MTWRLEEKRVLIKDAITGVDYYSVSKVATNGRIVLTDDQIVEYLNELEGELAEYRERDHYQTMHDASWRGQ